MKLLKKCLKKIYTNAIKLNESYVNVLWINIVHNWIIYMFIALDFWNYNFFATIPQEIK